MADPRTWLWRFVICPLAALSAWAGSFSDLVGCVVLEEAFSSGSAPEATHEPWIARQVRRAHRLAQRDTARPAASRG